MIKVATVTLSQLDRIQDGLVELNRRAQKLGMQPLTLVELSREDKMVRDGRLSYTITWVTIQVTGESPVINGWSLVAVVEPIDEANAMVRCVPGQSVDVSKYVTNQKMVCDHCNTIRRRSEVFVIRHQDGTEKQVGRSCLVDFIGTDQVERLLNQASFSIEVDELFEEGFGGGGQSVWTFDEVLMIGLLETQLSGYTSKNKAEMMCCMPTSGIVKLILTNPVARKEWEKAIADLPVKHDEQLRQYVKDLVPTNDFTHNVKALFNANVVRYKDVGYVVGCIPGFFKSIEEAQERADKPVSNHVGAVKDKVQLVVRVTGYHPFDGAFGTTYIIRMVTDEGNQLTWFASSDQDWAEIGNRVTIKGTVKKLDEYKGVRQTVLTRVKKV